MKPRNFWDGMVWLIGSICAGVFAVWVINGLVIGLQWIKVLPSSGLFHVDNLLKCSVSCSIVLILISRGIDYIIREENKIKKKCDK
jgi:hypothetical protein